MERFTAKIRKDKDGYTSLSVPPHISEKLKKKQKVVVDIRDYKNDR